MTSISLANATVTLPSIRQASIRINKSTTDASSANGASSVLPVNQATFSRAVLSAVHGGQSADAQNDMPTIASSSETSLFATTASTINTLTDDDKALLSAVTGWRAPDGSVTDAGLQASGENPFIPLLAGVIAERRKLGFLTGPITPDLFSQMVDWQDRYSRPDLEFTKSQISAGLQYLTHRKVS